MEEIIRGLQRKFFDQIREMLSTRLSLVDVVADDLGVSIDSAYRRIRGETLLTFKELHTLCVKYGVSLDSFLSGSHDTVLFNYRAIDPEHFSFDDYLSSIVSNLATMNGFQVKELIYAAKDIPLFYLYMFDRLSAFKIFFWSRNVFQFPEFKRMKFSLNTIPAETIETGKKIWKQYLKIPSIEIWSDESINVTLKQIRFCKECELFEDEREMASICEDLLRLIEHLEAMAEHGYKFDLDGQPGNPDCYYKLYYNEILISDNTVFFKMGDVHVTHLGHNVLDILTSTDQTFCCKTHETMQNIIKNSTLISLASARMRSRFFNSMRKKVDALMNESTMLL